MGSINRVFLIGNLGQDPESKELENGRARTTFSVATSESWNDKKTGEKVEQTEWHRIVSWGKTAEVVAKYLGKGSQVCVEGRLQTHKWQDKEGKDHTRTEVVADGVTFLGRLKHGSAEAAS
jgi:single-strand DNA-binding protein